MSRETILKILNSFHYFIYDSLEILKKISRLYEDASDEYKDGTTLSIDKSLISPQVWKVSKLRAPFSFFLGLNYYLLVDKIQAFKD